MDVLEQQPGLGGQVGACWGVSRVVSPQNAQNPSGRPKPGFLAVFPLRNRYPYRYQRARLGVVGA